MFFTSKVNWAIILHNSHFRNDKTYQNQHCFTTSLIFAFLLFFFLSQKSYFADVYLHLQRNINSFILWAAQIAGFNYTGCKFYLILKNKMKIINYTAAFRVKPSPYLTLMTNCAKFSYFHKVSKSWSCSKNWYK